MALGVQRKYGRGYKTAANGFVTLFEFLIRVMRLRSVMRSVEL